MPGVDTVRLPVPKHILNQSICSWAGQRPCPDRGESLPRIEIRRSPFCPGIPRIRLVARVSRTLLRRIVQALRIRVHHAEIQPMLQPLLQMSVQRVVTRLHIRRRHVCRVERRLVHARRARAARCAGPVRLRIQKVLIHQPQKMEPRRSLVAHRERHLPRQRPLVIQREVVQRRLLHPRQNAVSLHLRRRRRSSRRREGVRRPRRRIRSYRKIRIRRIAERRIARPELKNDPRSRRIRVCRLQPSAA